jgi:hypothetical protein
MQMEWTSCPNHLCSSILEQLQHGLPHRASLDPPVARFKVEVGAVRL